jgi:TonB family protein
MQAGIQGKVELRLTVTPANGEVLSASVVSGHPLLNSSALEAAAQWRFAPGSISSEHPTLTLDFALRCQ